MTYTDEGLRKNMWGKLESDKPECYQNSSNKNNPETHFEGERGLILYFTVLWICFTLIPKRFGVANFLMENCPKFVAPKPLEKRVFLLISAKTPMFFLILTQK